MAKYNEDNNWNNPYPRNGKGTFLPGKPKAKAKAYQHPIDESGPAIRIKKPVLDAKKFLLDSLLPTIAEDEKELWYKCSPWAGSVVQIMEKYKKS